MQEPLTLVPLCGYFDRRIAGMEAAGKRSPELAVEERDLASRRRDAAVAFNVPVGIRFSTFWTGNWISQRPIGGVATRRKLIQNICIIVSGSLRAFLSKNNTSIVSLCNIRPFVKNFSIKVPQMFLFRRALIYVCAKNNHSRSRSLSVFDAMR